MTTATLNDSGAAATTARIFGVPHAEELPTRLEIDAWRILGGFTALAALMIWNRRQGNAIAAVEREDTRMLFEHAYAHIRAARLELRDVVLPRRWCAGRSEEAKRADQWGGIDLWGLKVNTVREYALDAEIYATGWLSELRETQHRFPADSREGRAAQRMVESGMAATIAAVLKRLQYCTRASFEPAPTIRTAARKTRQAIADLLAAAHVMNTAPASRTPRPDDEWVALDIGCIARVALQTALAVLDKVLRVVNPSAAKFEASN